MTHADCLAAVGDPLGVPAGRNGAPDERRRAAAAHLARCPDCVTALGRRFDSLPAARDLAARFDCEGVRDRLATFVVLDAAMLASRHPEAAQHLVWCHGCRDRLAELVAVEIAAAEGAFDEPAVIPAAGGPVRETLGALIVRLGRGVATFISVPDGAIAFPDLVPASTPRSNVDDAGAPAVVPVRRARLTLAASDTVVDLQVSPHGAERVDLEVSLVQGATAPRSVQLRAADGDELLGWQPLRSTGPAVLRDVPIGDYVLDVGDGTGGQRCRIPLRVDDGA